MPDQPTFFAEGSTPRRTDTKLRIQKKWLGELRNLGHGDSSMDPRRLDTKRQTQQKILETEQ